MRSFSGVLFPREEAYRTRSVDIASVVLPFVVGLILALLTLELGASVVPIVVFLFLILPWLVQDPFRLFIWLIVTWPVLSLYARIALPAGIPDISYERVLTPLTLGLILLAGLTSKRRLLRIGTLDVLAGAYIAVQFASRVAVLWFEGLGTLDLDGFLQTIILPILMYWMTKNLLVSRWHLWWLLYALILACMIICLSGLYERALGSPENPFPISAHNELGDTRYMGVPGGRAAGVVGNPAIYGAILGMGVLASLCCVVHAKRTRTQIVLWTTIVVLLYGVLVSYTRSTWLAVAVALFVAQFLMGNLWKTTLPVFLVSALLLVLLWGNLIDNPIVKSRILDPRNIVGRFDRARFAWDRFLEKPFTGWGHGALDILTLRQFPGDSGFSVSHNTFLTFLVDGGLVVFLSFSALIAYLLVEAIHIYRLAKRNSFERDLLIVMTGCILIFLVSGISIELRYFSYFNVLFWISAGVIDRLGAVFRSKEIASDLGGWRESAT